MRPLSSSAGAGFKSMKTAYSTIKGFELVQMFKKGQMDIWKIGLGENLSR